MEMNTLYWQFACFVESRTIWTIKLFIETVDNPIYRNIRRQGLQQTSIERKINLEKYVLPYFFLLYFMLYVTDNKLQLNFQLVTHEREA